MINEESLRVVGQSVFGDRFIRPIYDTYGFARLPDTTTALLTGKAGGPCLPVAALGGEVRRFGKVAVILLDAFGWAFMERALKSGRYPFLERMAEMGVISKLTTQFPSTTTAHVTTMKFGQPVGEHGLYEWNLYEPAVDSVIVPIQFKKAGENAESLRQGGVDPATIYPAGPTYYQQLAEQGVSSYVFETVHFRGSSYSSWINVGATSISFKTLSEGLVNLGSMMSRVEGPAYFFFYNDGIDAICHKYGPDSPEVVAEIDTTLTMLERVFFPLLVGQRDTALLLTADHGHAAVDPARTFYLNVEIPEITGWLKRDGQGNLLKLAGSSRDPFLHVKPEFLEAAEGRLKRLLAGRAEVYRTAELMEAGLFGPMVSERLQVRMADLVVLCHERETVWWYEKEVSEMRNLGSHGSLERSEAETFLGFQTFE